MTTRLGAGRVFGPGVGSAAIAGAHASAQRARKSMCSLDFVRRILRITKSQSNPAKGSHGCLTHASNIHVSLQWRFCHWGANALLDSVDAGPIMSENLFGTLSL